MQSNLESNVNKWIEVDNSIRNLSEKVKNLRNEKNQIENSILTYAERNNINNLYKNQ